MFINRSSFIFPAVLDFEALDELLHRDTAPFVRWKEGFAGRIDDHLLYAGLDEEMIEAMKKLDRTTQISTRLLRELRAQGADPELTLIGSARGASAQWESFHQTYLKRGRVPARTSPLTTAGGIATSAMQLSDVAGAALTSSMTCSSALHAIIQAARALKCDEYREVLAGGVEAPLTDFTYAQFEALRLLARREGAFPCLPFSKKRSNQLVLAEGGALFALSTSTPSSVRLAGWGESREVATESNTSMTSFASASVRIAMNTALSMAKIERPDLIIAHAPGTIQGDAGELELLRERFGEKVPVVSTKALTGHSLGASGALSLVFAIHFLKHGLPRVGVMQSGCEKPHSVLINATGFGGNAASLVVTREA